MFTFKKLLPTNLFENIFKKNISDFETTLENWFKIYDLSKNNQIEITFRIDDIAKNIIEIAKNEINNKIKGKINTEEIKDLTNTKEKLKNHNIEALQEIKGKINQQLQVVETYKKNVKEEDWDKDIISFKNSFEEYLRIIDSLIDKNIEEDKTRQELADELQQGKRTKPGNKPPPKRGKRRNNPGEKEEQPGGKEGTTQGKRRNRPK